MESFYDWEDFTNDWSGIQKADYTYDDKGNMILQVWYYWDFASYSDSFAYRWINGGKEESFYDQHGNKTVTKYYLWYTDANFWDLQKKLYLTYNSVDIPNGSGVTLYPNPFKDIINIVLPEETDFESFELFDANGKKVLNSKEYTPDLSFLMTGIYFIRVKDRNGILLKPVKAVKE